AARAQPALPVPGHQHARAPRTHGAPRRLRSRAPQTDHHARTERSRFGAEGVRDHLAEGEVQGDQPRTGDDARYLIVRTRSDAPPAGTSMVSGVFVMSAWRARTAVFGSVEGPAGAGGAGAAPGPSAAAVPAPFGIAASVTL